MKCPKCGSARYYQGYKFTVEGRTPIRECIDCGHEGKVQGGKE